LPPGRVALHERLIGEHQGGVAMSDKCGTAQIGGQAGTLLALSGAGTVGKTHRKFEYILVGHHDQPSIGWWWLGPDQRVMTAGSGRYFPVMPECVNSY
jgi:hypothetical protein